MPVFKNELDHAVYASAGGKSHKLGAGKVGAFTGDVADAFASLAEAGYVTELTGDEAKRALEAQRADSIDPTVTAHGAMPGEVAKARSLIGLMSVSAPLQVVIGDDSAPYGPPSGVVTTKQALANADPGGTDRRQFAENERLISDPKIGTGASAADVIADPLAREADVEDLQRQNRVDVEDIIDDLGLAGAQTANLPAGDGDADGGGDDYDSKSKSELQAAAAEKGLPTSGTVTELKSALRDHDAK